MSETGVSMRNLQDLYDYFIETKPTPGKVKAASSLLIRLCKVLNLNSAEEVTSDYYKEIPRMIDQYHGSSKNLAAQDKSVLAEMIGRYCPKDGWEATFEILLNDKDENLRQFTLHTLEYSEQDNPEISIRYIERYKNSPELIMRQVAAHLTATLMMGRHLKMMQLRIDTWDTENLKSFVKDVLEGLKNCNEIQAKNQDWSTCETARTWLKEKFNL